MSVNLAQTDGDAAQRLALTINGCSVAYVEFYLFENVAIVTHTEVDLPHQGKGLGTVIAVRALERFLSENRQVVPVCSFFLQRIRERPEYANLLTPHCRTIFAI